MKRSKFEIIQAANWSKKFQQLSFARLTWNFGWSHPAPWAEGYHLPSSRWFASRCSGSVAETAGLQSTIAALLFERSADLLTLRAFACRLWGLYSPKSVFWYHSLQSRSTTSGHRLLYEIQKVFSIHWSHNTLHLTFISVASRCVSFHQ